MRRPATLALLLSVAAACGGAQGEAAGTGGPAEPEDSSDARRRADLGCTERPAGGEEACVERGCTWGPGLSCYGTEPPPEQQEAERRAREEGSVRCECVCPADVEACGMVPSAPPPG